MKHQGLLTVLAGIILIILPEPAYNQIKSRPRSFEEINKLFLKNTELVAFSKTPIPKVDSLLNFESILNAEDRPKLELYGYAFEVNLNAKNSGTWDTLKNGDRIWRLRVICPGAYSLVGTTYATYELNKENGKYQKGVKS